jgi:hypothetical protein
MRMNTLKKLRKKSNLFINRNVEAEVFTNDAARLTPLLDLKQIGNMAVTCKPKEQIIQKETRLLWLAAVYIYLNHHFQQKNAEVLFC